MKKKAFAILSLAIAVMLSGCGLESAEKLSINEFAEKIADRAVIVLDVRTPTEFAQGHLDRAINIDFQGGNFENQVSKLDKSAKIAVYCRSGNRSGDAVKRMKKLGFTNLYDMDGGVIDWAAADRPLYR